jgi:very-short-patch-repair endonuclease
MHLLPRTPGPREPTSSTGPRHDPPGPVTVPGVNLSDVLRDCGVRSQGLVVTEQLRRAGVSRSALSRAVQAGDLIRIRRRVYAAQPLPALPRFVVTETGVAPAYVAHARAALLSLGPAATACGRTAAALRGWGLLVEPARTLEIALPHGRGHTRLAGARVGQRRHVRRERVQVLPGTEPLWLTSPLGTVVECCLTLPLLDAVVVCDSALRAGALRLDDLSRLGRSLQGVRHARRVRAVSRLCDPGSGSVLESVLRVRMVLAGVTGFASQTVLRDRDGRHLLRADFCFERAGLVVEVDGQRWHQDVVRDRARDNALARVGWRVLRYDWDAVVHDAPSVIAEVRAALSCGRPRIHLPSAAPVQAA